MRARLGQNFLVDKEVKQKIADLISPPGRFGEIGPGHGELTELLEKKFGRFVLFEKDEALVASLKKRNYEVVAGDFVDWDFKLGGQPVEDFSLVGNLPYESGTKILLSICEHSLQIPYFFFMLQKEVVERICARPQSRDFGSLSVLVQGQYDVEALDVIPPSAFEPAPQVDSQLVCGRRRQILQSRSPEYLKFIQLSFHQKRKTLHNNWKSRYKIELVRNVLDQLQLKPTARAEEIPVDLWPRLFEELNR